MLGRFKKKAKPGAKASKALDQFLAGLSLDKGHDLYQVIGPEDGACVCNDWIGAVVSIRGIRGDNPPLADAIADGVFHDGCRHSLLPFGPEAGPGNDIARAVFCTNLATDTFKARRQDRGSDLREEFTRLYDCARRVEKAGAPGVALALCEGALRLLNANDIFGDRQAEVARTLAARIATIYRGMDGD